MSRTVSTWVDDRTYALVECQFWCDACGEQGCPSLRDGVVCLLCGVEQREPFREGWDD